MTWCLCCGDGTRLIFCVSPHLPEGEQGAHCWLVSCQGKKNVVLLACNKSCNQLTSEDTQICCQAEDDTHV